MSPIPDPERDPTVEGITVCMHLRDFQATAASMVCDLPSDPDRPLRAWVALGSPCVSIYVPVFPMDGVPAALADPRTWERVDALRRRAESDPDALAAIRGVLAPLEADLWERADEAASDPAGRARFAATAWPLLDDALCSLERNGGA